MNAGQARKVSVVTPVYNTGAYLEQAMQSVLGQTHGDFEYIVCENHSTDDTREIAERIASTDSRVRVIRPPRFLSQVDNFNFALSHIAPDSEYVKVLMADDWMFPQCLADMVGCGEAHPRTSLIGAYRLEGTSGRGFGLPVEDTVIPGRVAGRLHLLQGIFLFGTPSTVMYRASVVRARNPEFYPLNRFFFDTDVVFRILPDSDFGFVHQVLTYSRDQPGSITNNVRNFYSRDLDRLLILHQYGRVYLDEAEYERAMSHALRVYYEGLGRQWLLERVRSPSQKFWDFHRKGLGDLGLTIDPKRLAIGAAGAAGRAVLSPFDLLRDVVRARRPVEDARKV